jgi:Glutamate 5-kinase
MARPNLKNFRRIVVKVGSSLLIDSDAGEVGQRGSRPGRRPCEAARRGTRTPDRILRLDRAGAQPLKLPRGALKLEESQAAAAVGQIALARSGRRCWASRHRRRADPGDLAGHRGAPPLSQRALDHAKLLDGARCR